MVKDWRSHISCKNSWFGKEKNSWLWPKMLLTNQIAVYFDHQILWKESIDNLD